MGYYTLNLVKSRILNWFNQSKSDGIFSDKEAEISKNTEQVLIIDFTFGYCLAQLIVNEAGFAPYKLVSFEAMTMDSIKSKTSGKPELIYFFYDSDETEERELMREIHEAVIYSLTYVPDELLKKYLGKKGFLQVENSKSKAAVHPDDQKKVNDEELAGNEYQCIDTEFQYLKVKCGTSTLRVLPVIFEVTLK